MLGGELPRINNYRFPPQDRAFTGLTAWSARPVSEHPLPPALLFTQFFWGNLSCGGSGGVEVAKSIFLRFP